MKFTFIIYILFSQVFFFFFLFKKNFFLNSKKKFNFFSDYLLNFFCLTYLILFLYYLLKNYFSPEDFYELRDSSLLNSAYAYLNNINPFSEKYFEQYGNLYSLIYPYILAKSYTFFYLDSNQSFVHLDFLAKIINLLFIIIIFSFFSFFLKNKKKNLIYFLLILSSFALSPWIAGSNPNLIGYSFFLIALGIFYFNSNPKYVFISYFLIFISSLFKQYYILGIIPIFLTNFFLKKNFLDFLYLFLILIFYLLIFYNNNIYFETIINFYLKFASQVEFKFLRIFHEISFILIFFPFLFFFPICSYILKIKLNIKQVIFIKTYFILIFFVVIKMWTNDGNFGNYTIQLFTPLLIFLSLTYLNQIKLKHNFDRFFFIILLFSCVLINKTKTYGIMSEQNIKSNRDVLSYVTNFKSLNNDKIFFVDSFFSSSFLDIKSNEIYDAGHRFYLSLLKKNKKIIPDNLNFDEVFTDEYDFLICALECTSSSKTYKYKLLKELTFYTLKQDKVNLHIYQKIN